MTAQIIDGRKIAVELKQQVAVEVRHLAAKGVDCELATIMVGEDYRSDSYEQRLSRTAAELGVVHRPVRLPASVSRDEVVGTVRTLNDDPQVSAVLSLRPLPAHLSEVEVFRTLSPVKDIEAVHPENAGLLALGVPRYVPSTAASVFHVLDSWLDTIGEDRAEFYHRSLIVVVGRSNNVGKPLVSLAYDRQVAVESIDTCASRSGRLGWHTRRADVLIVAAGVPGLIRSEHIHPGAVVIDVGINADPEQVAMRPVGDVHVTDIAGRARAMTSEPGGIGPITDVWVLRNTVSAASNAASTTIGQASLRLEERGERAS